MAKRTTKKSAVVKQVADTVMDVLQRLRDTARDEKLPEDVRTVCIEAMAVVHGLIVLAYRLRDTESVSEELAHRLAATPPATRHGRSAPKKKI